MTEPELGAPPPVSAWGRMRPYMGSILTIGMLGGVSLYALQIVMPEGYKPTEVGGDAAGAFERHEIQGKMAARLEYDRRSADAVAQAQTKAQMDMVIVQTAMNNEAANLGGLGGASVLADVACIAGKVIAANTQPTLGADWRRPNTGGDWHSGAQTVADATCGLGTVLRQEVQRSMFTAAQNAAASRGMSITDGSVRQASTVQPVRTGPAVQEVAARPAVPHREWTQDQRAQLRAYAEKQPRATLIQFVEGIDTVHNGLTPEWYDRVAAHRFEHPEQ